MVVTDSQVRTLWTWLGKEASLRLAAAKAGMDRKTARKYRRTGQLPSQRHAQASPRAWRTRADPFAGVWGEVEALLDQGPGWEVKTLFEELQRRYPGRFAAGQLRTLQRRVKHWRATRGPAKEVFFAQEHPPGQLGASDFTHLTDLGVTVGGQPFAHLVDHFVLTHSNWEHVTVCFSESFESFSAGFQDAVWALGGVPAGHRSDRMSLAVQASGTEEFTRRYAALMAHYGVRPQAINAGRSPRERRRRAEPSPLQAGGAAGPALARQSRLPQPGGVRGVPARGVRAPEPAAGGASQGRIEMFEGVADAAPGVGPAGPRARAVGQHDRPGAEHLLRAG